MKVRCSAPSGLVLNSTEEQDGPVGSRRLTLASGASEISDADGAFVRRWLAAHAGDSVVRLVTVLEG